MSFILLDIVWNRNYKWFSIGMFECGRFQTALFHVEYSIGVFKWDFLGIKSLYKLIKYELER